MKQFSVLEIEQAIAYSMAGGQSLHCHQIIVGGPGHEPPQCFVDAVNRGEMIAHLFDQDESRLRKTARALGVNIIVVERRGGKGQHIDLCSGPLRKAKAICEVDKKREAKGSQGTFGFS